MTDHPITPPPELRRIWAQQAQRMDPCDPVTWLQYVSAKAARWGADQELAACCSEMNDWGDIHNSAGWELSQDLRAARRPKPLSLAEQGLEALNRGLFGVAGDADTILRALERLQELEGNG